MRKSVLLAFTLVLSLFLTSCKKDDDDFSTKVISYSLEGEPSTLDPQTAVDCSAKTVILNVFEGLTRLDRENKVCKGVAKSWNCNHDKTVYTFNLREDAVWNNRDNTPVTAHDFVFGITRAVSKETDYKNVENLYCIKNAQKINMQGQDISTLGVKALDDRTLVVELEYPCENFLEIVSTTPFMPCNKKFFESSTGQYGREYNKIITNGPFQIKNKYSWVHYEKLELSKNESYKGDHSPICGGVDFSFTKNEADLVSKFNSEKLDAVKITENELSKINQNNANILPFKNSVCGICFNMDNKLFGNYDIRNAFLSSLDRQYLEGSLPENYIRTKNIILDNAKLDGKPYRASVGDCNEFSQDVNLAKSSLVEGMKTLKLEKLPDVTVLCLDTPYIKSLVSRMIETWNNTFNVYLNMKPVSKDELADRVYSKSYQIAVYGLRAPISDAVDLVKMFRTSEDNNFLSLSDSRYDQLLDNITNASSYEQKSNNILSAENFLISEKVFYPLYNGSQYFVCAKNVSDLLFYPYDGGIDFTKAKKSK